MWLLTVLEPLAGWCEKRRGCNLVSSNNNSISVVFRCNFGRFWEQQEVAAAREGCTLPYWSSWEVRKSENTRNFIVNRVWTPLHSLSFRRHCEHLTWETCCSEARTEGGNLVPVRLGAEGCRLNLSLSASQSRSSGSWHWSRLKFASLVLAYLKSWNVSPEWRTANVGQGSGEMCTKVCR